MFTLSQKDLLELKFWATLSEKDRQTEARLLDWYADRFGLARRSFGKKQQVLEIGAGPWWGLLPRIQAHRHYAVDPLFPAYEAMGLLKDRNGIMRVDERFELWDTGETFDLIVTTNALDHGAMGFHLIPRIAALLRPGGRLLLHVHLRGAHQVNLLHDHRLTLQQFEQYVEMTYLECEWSFDEPDPTGFQCLIGEWVKPE